MSYVSRTRAAAVFGLLSIILSIVGLVIHGYPAIGASGKEIADWATTTDQQRFETGIYIEALGYLLFLPFAAWLRSAARDAGSGWLVSAGFGAIVLYVGLSVADNGIWSSLLDGARRGADPQTLASVRDIAENVFRGTLLFGGMFFVPTGYALFRGRALPRWVGATALVIGLGLLVPPLAIIAAFVVWIWTLAVSLYLLARPGAVAVREPSGAVAGPAAAGAP